MPDWPWVAEYSNLTRVLKAIRSINRGVDFILIEATLIVKQV